MKDFFEKEIAFICNYGKKNEDMMSLALKCAHLKKVSILYQALVCLLVNIRHCWEQAHLKILSPLTTMFVNTIYFYNLSRKMLISSPSCLGQEADHELWTAAKMMQIYWYIPACLRTERRWIPWQYIFEQYEISRKRLIWIPVTTMPFTKPIHKIF